MLKEYNQLLIDEAKIRDKRIALKEAIFNYKEKPVIKQTMIVKKAILEK